MEWIWKKGEDKGIFEFEKEFEYGGKGKAILKIGADFRYAAYINGKFVSNGQLADLPNRKFINECDVTHVLQNGKNVLRVSAVHTGADFFQARTMTPGIAFEISVGGAAVAVSDRETLCRKSSRMSFADTITPQLGYGYRYDFTAKENGWEKAELSPCGFRTYPRPIKNLRISSPLPQKIVAQGIFKYRDGEAETAAHRMNDAWLSVLPFAEMTGEGRYLETLNTPLEFKAKGGDGIFVIADLGRETAGHLSFSVQVPAACKAIIGWGEHLADLRVRTYIDGRNFAESFMLKAGKNEFENFLERLGCRYLCMFIESESAVIERLTLCESTYPFDKPEKDFGNGRLNAIYETARRSLELCAHEHYEDCPWREQALYGTDSRRQALMSYGAFGDYTFARESFRLFAYSMRADNLVQLCAPADTYMTIPSYTIGWMLGVCENAELDYDEEFVKEMLPFCERALENFEKRTTREGITVFTETPYWNFHDWSPGLEGGNFNRTHVLPPDRDGILTCMTCRAVRKLAALEKKAGFAEKSAFFAKYADKLAASLENFYDAEKGIYAAYLRDGGKKDVFHQQMQASVLLCGGAPESRIKKLVRELQDPSEGVVRMPYSLVKYEAILSSGGDLQYCVDEICKVYGSMLDCGSTSFWETEAGERDFNNAGSLCHGWSAVACYVFDNYLPNKRK